MRVLETKHLVEHERAKPKIASGYAQSLLANNAITRIIFTPPCDRRYAAAKPGLRRRSCSEACAIRRDEWPGWLEVRKPKA